VRIIYLLSLFLLFIDSVSLNSICDHKAYSCEIKCAEEFASLINRSTAVQLLELEETCNTSRHKESDIILLKIVFAPSKTFQ